MDTVIPLTSLKVGEVARIVSINARGELARRIRDMGLGSGMPVSVVGYAPLRTRWPCVAQRSPLPCAAERPGLSWCRLLCP